MWHQTLKIDIRGVMWLYPIAWSLTNKFIKIRVFDTAQRKRKDNNEVIPSNSLEKHTSIRYLIALVLSRTLKWINWTTWAHFFRATLTVRFAWSNRIIVQTISLLKKYNYGLNLNPNLIFLEIELEKSKIDHCIYYLVKNICQ